MAQHKGCKKIGGRQKGTSNKKTIENLKRAEYILSILDETIDVDLKSLEAKERVKLWVDLQEYVAPKLARIEQDITSGNEKIQITIQPMNDKQNNN